MAKSSADTVADLIPLAGAAGQTDTDLSHQSDLEGQIIDVIYGDEPWALLDGPRRIRLKLGQSNEALRAFWLRNKKTGKVKSFRYEHDVDWNNKRYMRKIRAWRTQILSKRNGFQCVLEQDSWSSHEEAWLEVLLEKFNIASAKDGNISYPTGKEILSAFIQYFEGKSSEERKRDASLQPYNPRNDSQVLSRLRREHTQLAELQRKLKLQSNNGKVEFDINIGEADIKLYLSDHKVVFEGQKYHSVLYPLRLEYNEQK